MAGNADLCQRNKKSGLPFIGRTAGQGDLWAKIWICPKFGKLSRERDNDGFCCLYLALGISRSAISVRGLVLGFKV